MVETAYFGPETLEEALSLLAETATDARVVAGGTDVVVAARQGRRPLDGSVVAIHTIDALRGIARADDGSLRLGALVTHNELECSPLVRGTWSALADAAGLIGSPSTRACGTLGGNLVNGSPAMETGSPLLALDAAVELSSQRGSRLLRLADFLRGPGVTACAPDELLVAVTVPQPPPRTGSGYARIGYRRAMEIAVVGAAAAVSLDDSGRIDFARIALTAVAPVCVRAEEAESLLLGTDGGEAAISAAALAAVRSAAPIGDSRAPESYREAMVPIVTRRALNRALDRARTDSKAEVARTGDTS